MTPARPNLAAVLAALTDTDAWQWTDVLRFDNAVPIATATDVGVFWQDDAEVWHPIPLATEGIGDGFRALTRVPWITTDAAFAWEVLQTRGLIPMDYVGRFVCSTCKGWGRVRWQVVGEGRPVINAGSDAPCPCGCVRGALPRPAPHPTSLPDLVSWASLGFKASDDGKHPGILGMEEIGRRTREDVWVQWQTGALRDRPYLVGGADMALDSAMNTLTITIPPLQSSPAVNTRAAAPSAAKETE